MWHLKKQTFLKDWFREVATGRNRRYAVVDKTYSENASIMLSVVLSNVCFRVTAVF